MTSSYIFIYWFSLSIIFIKISEKEE
jgi:hypothetical protein